MSEWNWNLIAPIAGIALATVIIFIIFFSSRRDEQPADTTNSTPSGTPDGDDDATPATEPATDTAPRRRWGLSNRMKKLLRRLIILTLTVAIIVGLLVWKNWGWITAFVGISSPPPPTFGSPRPSGTWSFPTELVGSTGLLVFAVVVILVLIALSKLIIRYAKAIGIMLAAIVMLVAVGTGVVYFGAIALKRANAELTDPRPPSEEEVYPRWFRLYGGQVKRINIHDGTCLGYPDRFDANIDFRMVDTDHSGYPEYVEVRTVNASPAYSVIFRFHIQPRGSCA